ncbi:TRAP transporter substrate-binding protein [Mesorhizobium sp.]|uniref:TRAP transporter substrate-binding protein n=1 Tax=Mesorhizobium sp. TaxID=1871066 RepID=UPI000FE67801|nr:TRAP transporter substrate-binding protein [Mesorhizobium sp.]RWI88933.1 MAG: TRAP transporter substrate-binding protein [Mesorhizobium sp.]
MKTNAVLAGKASRREVLKLGVTGLAATALFTPRSRAADVVTMKLGSDSPDNHPYNIGLAAWKAEIEKASDGRIQCKIYPNAQLGGEEDMTNGLKIGAIDGMFASTGVITPFLPEIGIFDLPFLFKDRDHVVRAANSVIADRYNGKIQDQIGADVLGWRTLGSRNMWNGRHPILTPDDVKGLKMRVQSSAIQQATYLALGALPATVPFVEVYTSMQTKVVDGADVGIADIIPLKFYQVTKYMSMTRHFYIMNPLYVSRKFLSKLSDVDQDIVRKAGAKCLDACQAAADRIEQDGIAFLRDKGMEIKEDIDLGPFREKTASVITQNATKLGGQDFLDKVTGA